ncbi:autotransporter outer membrane beta-barrel domain-containing protein [Tenacibaculum xiamenense]|uniref:hypothetical protein n=1 Tax=Tenacibaculum xiamenense TaxID=1261553 RepID=UPI003893E4FE
MKKSKETLKAYFETGDKPTQEQYGNLIDSYVDAKQFPGEANRRFVIDETGEVSVASEAKLPEYTLSEIVGNKLSLLKDGVVVKEIDLTTYLDDTNLSRLVSGTVDPAGIATFKRDDNSTFTVDFSTLLGGSSSQVQADWNQTDNTQGDFIKNKPNLNQRVPYSGAIQNIDINRRKLVNCASLESDNLNMTSPAGGLIVFKNSSTNYRVNIKQNDASTSSSFDLRLPPNGGVLALEENMIPYTGANKDVDLGNNTIEASKNLEVPNKARHKVALRSNGQDVFKVQTEHWNGSSWVNGTNSLHVGPGAGNKNTGKEVTFLGLNAGINNTGNTSTGIGLGAGANNIKDNFTGVGLTTGLNNTGNNFTGLGAGVGGGNSGNFFTGAGYYTGNTNTGENFSGYGFRAGVYNTGGNVTLIGARSGENNKGSNCSFLGVYSGTSNTKDNITAMGYYAGNLNTGLNLVAVGSQSGQNNTGSNVVAIGSNSSVNNTGSVVTAVGYAAGYSNSGSNVVAVGAFAGYENVKNYNVFLGSDSGRVNSGEGNSAIGYQSLKNNTGNANVALGYHAGLYNTGASNVLIGNSSGASNGGFLNTAIGIYSMSENSGNYCVGIGAQSLRENKALDAVGVGYQVLYNNPSTGKRNVAMGTNAMQQAYGSTGSSIVIGYNAGLFNNATGNVSIGEETLQYTGSGVNQGYNTVLGYRAARNPVDSSLVKTVADNSKDIDSVNNRITLMAHGFGSVGATVVLKYNISGGASISGLTNNLYYNFVVIDSNTIEFQKRGFTYSTADSGIHTFTLTESISNSTALGANSKFTKANQVALGDENIEEVLTAGQYIGKAFKVKTLNNAPTSSTAAGEEGEIRYTADYIYVCVAANSWKRTALTTW